MIAVRPAQAFILSRSFNLSTIRNPYTTKTFSLTKIEAFLKVAKYPFGLSDTT
jgi:hypothetical protein